MSANDSLIYKADIRSSAAQALITTWLSLSFFLCLSKLYFSAISIRQSRILFFFPIENFLRERPILTNIFHSD